jgi:hypothetical protein
MPSVRKAELKRQVRPRFWVQVGLASTTGFLCVLTLAWRDWIEAVVGVDPDQHSGSLEWGLVLSLLAVTVLVAMLARAEWRRSIRAVA